MKETGIIMSGNHPKLILDGIKTMTRRVIKPQPICKCDKPNWQTQNIDWIGYKYEGRDSHFCHTCGAGLKLIDEWSGHGIICPYGQVGDRHFTYFKDNAPPEDGYYEVIWKVGDLPRLVYLRRHSEPDLPTDIPTEYEWERWLWGKDEHDDPEAIGLDICQPELIQWRRVGDRLWVRESWCQDWDIAGVTKKVIYKASAHPRAGFVWKPSIHMPRWASRITLEITEVRVERVQDIIQSDNDMRAEGIPLITYDNNKTDWGEMAVKFQDLWDSLNAKRGYGWMTDPWVWVISFKVVSNV